MKGLDLAILILMSLLFSTPGLAVDRVWVGESGSWHHAPNWDVVVTPQGLVGGIPKAGDRAEIITWGFDQQLPSREIWLDADTTPLSSIIMGDQNELATNGNQLAVQHTLHIAGGASLVVTPTA